MEHYFKLNPLKNEDFFVQIVLISDLDPIIETASLSGMILDFVALEAGQRREVELANVARHPLANDHVQVIRVGVRIKLRKKIGVSKVNFNIIVSKNSYLMFIVITTALDQLDNNN